MTPSPEINLNPDAEYLSCHLKLSAFYSSLTVDSEFIISTGQARLCVIKCQEITMKLLFGVRSYTV